MSINLNLRGDLGRKLTISELDSNFSNIQDAINNGTSGSSKTFQLKAHSSLTTDDIGKFVISYSDPSWNDYIIGGGTPSSFTGSYNEARLPFLSGTTSGTNGKWTIDFAATYGGKDWEQLQDNERFIEIQFSNQLSIFKYNLQFQELDPYLSPIINSMTYSFDDIGQGTFSFTEDPTSLAILFEYYVNNGIPWEGSVNTNTYTADGRFGGKGPDYFITNTYSTPFVSATRSGTSVQFEISRSTQNFNSIYYFGNNSNVEADVPLDVEQPIPYLTYPVVGILESLEGGTASIGQIPEVIELSPTTGIYDGTQEQFTDIIVAFNSSTTNEFANFANYWYVSGGDDLINLLYFYQDYDLPAFAMSTTSPLYRAISSGMVGDKIKFIKSIVPLK